MRNRRPWQRRHRRSCSYRSGCCCDGFCCYRWGRRRGRGDWRDSHRWARDWCSHRNRRPGRRSGWGCGYYCRRFWRWFDGDGRRDWTRRGRWRWRRRGPCSWPNFRRRSLRLLLSFRSNLVVSELLEMLPHKHGMINVNRTRVSLLLGYADLGKIINQHLRLDLQLSRQFVDSDLIRV